ncbi:MULTISPECIES: hypothetical protein [unclassified Streptomyces]
MKRRTVGVAVGVAVVAMTAVGLMAISSPGRMGRRSRRILAWSAMT